MSIAVMSDVWRYGPANSNEVLVMLAFANFCDDDGGNCFPKIKRVASMVRQTERTVTRIIAKLETEGWLTVERSVNGRGIPSRYTIQLDKLRPKKGDNHDTLFLERVTSTTEKGDNHDTANNELTIINHQSSLALSSRGVSKAEKKQKTDPRHAQCKALIFNFYKAMNKGREPAWGPQDAKQLADVLKSEPKLTADDFDRRLVHYADSDGINFDHRPAKFLARLVSFDSNPLDKFGRPKP